MKWFDLITTCFLLGTTIWYAILHWLGYMNGSYLIQSTINEYGEATIEAYLLIAICISGVIVLGRMFWRLIGYGR